jgi:hypothetical protein
MRDVLPRSSASPPRPRERRGEESLRALLGYR